MASKRGVTLVCKERKPDWCLEMVSSLLKNLYNWSYIILSNTLTTTEMTEIARSVVVYVSWLTLLNNRVAWAHFCSSEKDLLSRSLNGPEIISAHSRINLAEILTSPESLDLDNLFRWAKTTLLVIWQKRIEIGMITSDINYVTRLIIIDSCGYLCTW